MWAEDEETLRSWESVAKETEAIYRLADLAYAAFSCPASSACCQLTKRQRQPWLWPSEWKLLEETALEKWGQLPQVRVDGACPFLDDEGKRCRVYEIRPLGCRTYFCDKRSGPKKEPLATMSELSKRLEFLNSQWQPQETAPKELLTWLSSSSRGQ